MPRFLKSSHIAAPIEKVWAFHEAPDALEKLNPPGQGIRVLSRSGGIDAGARLIIEVPVLGPFKMQWHALHTVCEPPRRFVDVQEKGPFAYWRHEHRLEPEPGGTRLTDDIEFRVFGGPLGQFFAAPFVRWQLNNMFEYRHRVTKNTCESRENS